MSLLISTGRRAASGLPFLPLGPSIVPGMDSAAIRQQAGWGYSGIHASGATPAIGGTSRFIYRPIRRRLKAKKRSVS